jgi:hypothetical protein
MSVWIYVIVECDNPAVIKECVAALKDSDADKCTGWKDGDTRIKVEMNAFDIHFDIEKVSKCFPNDVITCVYGYDNTPGDSYTSEYRNGERIHHSVRAAYHFLRMPLTNEEDVAKIYEKTGTFFHRLDTPVTDQNGRTTGSRRILSINSILMRRTASNTEWRQQNNKGMLSNSRFMRT